MTHFEFLIPRRPLSLQAKNTRLQSWKAFVRAEAAKGWKGSMLDRDLHLTLVYLYDESPPDLDNIIKPIQDALVGLVLIDDSQVADVEGHRRPLKGIFDLTSLPPHVIEGVTLQKECVYVRVSHSEALEVYP
ncbi:MAG: hypothetical protein OHK0012_09740 [Synechococcales cyanobacterium]